MTFIALWMASLELAYGCKEIVACLALIFMSCFPFAKRILKDRINDNEIKMEPISWPSATSLTMGITLAGLAKAAIYRGAGKPAE